MKAIRTVISLCALIASPAFAQFEEQAALSVDVKGNREVYVDNNPFVHKCFGASELPPILSPQLNVDRDVQSGLYLITFQFRSESEAQLALAGSKSLPLKRDQSGRYNLSLLLPGVAGEVKTQLNFKTDGDLIRYELVAEIEGMRAAIRPLLSRTQSQQVCMKNQIWAGVGGSLFFYKQAVEAIEADAEFVSLSAGSYHLEGRLYPVPRWGLIASYKSAPGKMDAGQVTGVEETDFQWNILELATQYRDPQWLMDYKGLLIYPYLRSSVQQHSIPKIGIDPTNQVFFENLEFTDATLGLGANVFTEKHYFFEAYLNLKYPILARDLNLRPSLMFDGAIGVGKHLGKNVTAGAFWYGHSDRFRYQKANSRDPREGRIDFTFSNFDIRLGYLF